MGIHAPVMVVKGDGTLVSSALAKERPVETIFSGPAASLAGARFLTGLSNAMVVDIGGTTTDIGNLKDGIVEVTPNGVKISGHKTHVKALNMRTIGLGGDSLIYCEEQTIKLGPQRVAPIVWADTQIREGLDPALLFMEASLKKSKDRSYSPLIIVVAMQGEFPFKPTDREIRVYKTLSERPYAFEELAKAINLASPNFLPLKRLEESGLVQRCGLTPTDLLHVNGSFRKWNPEAAFRMISMLASQCQTKPKMLIDSALKKFEKNLAKELIKKQLSLYVEVDEARETALSNHFMKCILSGKKNPYSITFKFEHPIIGIGAPVHHFLPNAVKKLNSNAVIPDHADVANAVGAITSNITIKQKACIRPKHDGCYIVEGIEGCRKFTSMQQAETWTINQLKNRVIAMGKIAGTTQKTVRIGFKDRMVPVADGTNLFLDRTIHATLSGNPDLL